MKLKSTIRWGIALFSILAFQSATADSSTVTADLPEDVYRLKYEQSRDMPDHLAYLALMYNLTIAEGESGRAKNLDHVQTHMSFDRGQANEFLDFVLGSYAEMVDTNRTITNRMLCTGETPRYNPDNAYAVLDILDDIKDTNLKRKYEIVELRFGEEVVTELTNWLAAIKTGTSHHKYDHKKVYEHMDQSVEQVISVACNHLAAYMN